MAMGNLIPSGKSFSFRCLKFFIGAILSLGVGSVCLPQSAHAYDEGTWGPFPRVNPGDSGTCSQWARRLMCSWADDAATSWVGKCLAQARRVCEKNNGVFNVVPLSGQTTTEDETFSCKVTFKTDWTCNAKQPAAGGDEGDLGEEETGWEDEGYDWNSYVDTDLSGGATPVPTGVITEF